MIKIIFLLIVSITISTQFVFAHPYINNASVNDVNGPIPGIKIMGLENNQKSSNSESEFLSDEWIVLNFVWMLLGGIGIFMGGFVIVVYRENLPNLKFFN